MAKVLVVLGPLGGLVLTVIAGFVVLEDSDVAFGGVYIFFLLLSLSILLGEGLITWNNPTPERLRANYTLALTLGAFGVVLFVSALGIRYII